MLSNRKSIPFNVQLRSLAALSCAPLRPLRQRRTKLQPPQPSLRNTAIVPCRGSGNDDNTTCLPEYLSHFFLSTCE